MYSLESVQVVRDLHAEGMSVHKIAKQMKMSRNTISGMLKGTVQRTSAKVIEERKKSKLELSLQEKYPTPINPNSLEGGNGANGKSRKIQYERCEGCGGMVQKEVSCLACNVKLSKAPSVSCYFNLIDELLVPCVGHYPSQGMTT